MTRRFWIFSLFVLLALALAAGALHLKSRSNARAEIQKRLDAIRAAGQPVTAQDMAKLYPDPPPERDAAHLLAPAMNTVSIPDSASDLPLIGNGSLPRRGQPFDAQTESNIQAVLQDNQAAFEAVPWERITNAWVGLGFANGFTNMAYFRVSELSKLARLLCLDAINDAQFNRAQDASQKLLHSLELVHIMRSDIWLHHLVRRVYENRVCVALERTLNLTELPASELSRLQDALADDRPESLIEAFVNLRCYGIGQMEMIRMLPVTAFGWEGANVNDSKFVAALKSRYFGTIMWLTGKTYSDSDFLRLLVFRAEQLSALKLPPKERFAELARIQTAITNRLSNQTIAENFSAIRMDLPQFARKDLETLAQLRVVQTAVAIERWRQIHNGRLPESLSELTPEVMPKIPTDPFDEKPVRYKKLVRGYVVYSIGPDFTDDGGLEKPEEPKASDHYDITFIVER